LRRLKQLQEDHMSKTPNSPTGIRVLNLDEIDAVGGGFFAFHATTAAIDAVAKALATMAQKQ
jgi:hypothetical protein